MPQGKNFRYIHLLSSVSDNEPQPEDLKYGELAINNYAGDEKLFIKNSDGYIVSFSKKDNDIQSLYASSEEKYIYLTFESGRESLTADCSSWFSGLQSRISSMSYDSDYNYLYLYFENGENVSCSLDGICSGINDIPVITDLYHRDSGSYEYVIGLSYHYLNDSQTTYTIEDDISDWLSGCVRSLSASVDTGYPQHKELGQGRYLLRKYSDTEHGSELFFAEQVDDWFLDFYDNYVAASAYTNGTTIEFYTSGGTYLFSAEYTDTNDNDFVTDFYYSNDSGKTLTLEATNGTWTASLDNLALDCDITSGVTAYTSYGDNEYLMFYRNCGKAYSADVSSWFDYYVNSGYVGSNYTIYLSNSHTDSHVFVPLDLSSWFMGWARQNDVETLSSQLSSVSGDVSNLSYAFNTHSGDTCAHVTCSKQQYWDSKMGYEDISGFAKCVEYVSAYTSGSTTVPALVFHNTEYPQNNSVVYALDATPLVKDGMVNTVQVTNIDGVDYLEITFNTDAGKQPILIPLSSIFNPDNFYNKTQADSRFVTGITTGSNTYDITYYDGTGLSHTFSLTGISGDVYSVSSAFMSHSADTCLHVTCQDQQNWNDTYSTVLNNSQNWNDAYSTVTGNSSNWDYAYSAVTANSSTWDWAANAVNSGTSNWNYAYSTVTGNSSNWDYAYTAVTANSSNWDSAYSTVNSHTGDSTIHVTSNDKLYWNNKTDESAFTAHTADTTIHFTADDLINSGFVTTQYTAYTEVTDTIADNDMSPITSNAVHDVLDGLKLKKISQSDYDDLVDAGTVDANTLYVIIN